MSESGARSKVEQLRRQEASERRRRLIAIGAVSAAVVGVIGVAGYLTLSGEEADPATGQGLVGVGTAATCLEDELVPANGSGEHVETQVDYETTPPAFGPHRPLWEQVVPGRKFYTADDRPEVEALVHNLEHGYTVLWYDDTVANDEEALDAVEEITEKFPGPAVAEGKFIAVPWTAEDGEPFPGDNHVALSHWSVKGEGQTGQGVIRYCTGPDGAEVDDFMTAWPYSDSPEPFAG
ncbi:DUF3105 domain-containing protein [Nocardioidaceae bacterium]|nr:DUF3105 domain-containing protein [Nocardioidaceae bacterium]